MTTNPEQPGPFEHEWADRVESDRVWSPDGGSGLRFSPTDDEPAAPEAPPAAWSVPPADPVPPRNRTMLIVATCLVVALLGAAVGAVLGSRHKAALRPAVAEQPFVPPTTTAPPTTIPAIPATPSPSTPTPSDPSTQTPSSPSSPSSPSTANADASRGVVNINTTLAVGGQAAGTGMVLTPTGEVLTNNHVIAGSSSISVQVGGSGPTYSATVVGTDATDDIAVIQLAKASGLTTVNTSASSVNIGDPVTAVGNALGRGGAPAVTTGSVTDLDQTITVADDLTGADRQLTNLIQTDAPLQPGDSGGPLLNAANQVVGMDTAASAGRRFRQGSQQGFAIPITKALTVAKQIESGQSSATVQIGPPAYLGVELATNNSGGSGGRSADPSTTPAAVSGVASGTPAAKAGLAAGDTITSLAGQRVDSVAALETVLAAHHPGDKVAIGWTDSSGNAHTATVQLASGPPK